MDIGRYAAFPQDYKTTDTSLNGKAHLGLTKREYFAAAALKGLISNSTLYQGYSSPTEMANQAVSIADALLIELEK